MAKIPCPTAILCRLFPGEADSPILNLSSEAPDPLIFSGVGYTPFDEWSPPPLGGTTLFTAKDCNGVEYSVSSQELANLLAAANAEICQLGGDAIFYANDAQTATSACENGTVFSYTALAGLFVAPFNNSADGEAWKAASNARALAYAQEQASLLAQQFCISAPTATSPGAGDDTTPDPPIVNPPGIIPGMPNLQAEPGYVCLGDELWPSLNTYAVRGQNSSAEYTFSVSSGALPPGVTLVKYDHNRAQLIGTPTTAGTYTFTIRAERTNMSWIFAEVSDTLAVFGITNPDLDDGSVGSPYNYQLETAGGTGTVLFTLIGTLPDGLTLSSDGLISSNGGSPTTAGTSNFSVSFTDDNGAGKTCTQALTIVIESGCVGVDWLNAPGTCRLRIKNFNPGDFPNCIACAASGGAAWDGTFPTFGAGLGFIADTATTPNLNSMALVSNLGGGSIGGTALIWHLGLHYWVLQIACAAGAIWKTVGNTGHGQFSAEGVYNFGSGCAGPLTLELEIYTI